MIRPISLKFRHLASAALLSAILLPINPAKAQAPAGVAGSADREIARRQDRSGRAAQAIASGDQAMLEKDYEAAMAQYKSAYDLLPDAVATDQVRAQALDRFSKAAMALADQRVKEGRYADAKALSEMVLAPGYNPGYRPAIALLAHLEDPEYFNQTVGPKFVASVEEVKKLLLEADGFYSSGRFDLAMKRTDQVLNIDPYNIGARRMQEKVNRAKTQYGDEAYTEARSRAIWQVTGAWQSPVRKIGSGAKGLIDAAPINERGTQAITSKLSRIILPSVNFNDATVRSAIDYLKQKSRELDTQQPDPALRGVNIVLKLDSAGGAGAGAAGGAAAIPGLEGDPAAGAAAGGVSPSDARITLALSNIPLGEALNYVAKLAGLKVKVEPYAVAIVPISEPTEALVTKDFRVPPSFLTAAPGAASGVGNSGALSGGGGGGGGLGGDASGAGAKLIGKMSAKEVLEASGVTFPPGGSANYLTSTSRLIVRNTQENMDLIEIIVATLNDDVPKQVDIEAKFVEINQNNTKELGFDWTLGAGNIGSSDKVFASGGSAGNAPGLIPSDYPFVNPGTNTPVGTNPVTNGNRSGETAITASAIDALLFGGKGLTQKAPGVLAIAGVFTDPQFQVVIRALNQMKGVDLLSAPRVTTKSGQRAVIEIIREFRYPTEFDPPQVPNEIGGGSSGGGVGPAAAQAIVVTPTTPTSFETRNTGVTLEVEPQVGPDGFTIELNLAPQVVEFEGFINYGTPIFASNGVTSSLLTTNIINQPIFSSRKVTTSVSIWDGQTVALGGLIREDVQKVNDKTPVLGDLPLVGRAFRSSVDQHTKKNLTIFVTARLLDPSGQPISLKDEEEELVEASIIPESFTVAPPPPGSFAK